MVYLLPEVFVKTPAHLLAGRALETNCTTCYIKDDSWRVVVTSAGTGEKVSSPQ
jgi:hypothetical protein